MNRVQERIRGDGAIPWIGNGGTYKPDLTSISAAYILLAFRSAAIGLKLVIEFMGGQNDGSSIQTEAVLRADGGEYGSTDRIGRIRGLCEPEVSNDPHAQEIVAEITEGA